MTIDFDVHASPASQIFDVAAKGTGDRATRTIFLIVSLNKLYDALLMVCVRACVCVCLVCVVCVLYDFDYCDKRDASIHSDACMC